MMNLKDPEKWFREKYSIDILGERLDLIEFNGHDVIQFIRNYLIGHGVLFPINEQEEKLFDRSHENFKHELSGNEIDPFNLLRELYKKTDN